MKEKTEILNRIKSNPVSIIILAIVAIIVYLFSANAVWLGDDLRYQYKYTEYNNSLVKDYDEFHDTVDSFSDIVESLTIHHQYVNGRDVAHFFVHLFCGILGQNAFALCNAVMYILFICLLLKVCNASLSNPASVLTASLATLLCLQIWMMPAYQINYIWMFTLVLGFLALMFRGGYYNTVTLIFLSIYSLVSGAAHEGLNLGIGGALIIYWLFNRKRFTVSQYVMSISFGIGLIWMCLAPGNFVRMDHNVRSFSIASVINFFIYTKASYLLVIITLYKVYKYRKKSIQYIYSPNSFYWNVWVLLIAFNFFVLGIQGSRPLLGEELIAIVLSIRILKDHTFSKIWLILLSVISVFFLYIQAIYCIKSRKEWEAITSQYNLSSDNEIYLPEFVKTSESFITPYCRFVSSKYINDNKESKSFKSILNKQLHNIYGNKKPDIILLPEYLSGKDSIDIGNRIVKCGDGIYLLVQSKKAPKDFYVNRSINLAGIIKKSYEPVKIEFDHVLKETDLWRAQLICEDDITVMHISDNEIICR